jgi:hypothetical protein
MQAPAAGNVARVRLDAPGALLASAIFRPLSTNGPFLDLHFGQLDEQTPVGVTNKTGLQLQGLHLHDGQRNGAGLIGFGKIVYFLFSSPEWNARYNTSAESVAWARAHCPLPPENVVPAHPDFLLRLGDGGA